MSRPAEGTGQASDALAFRGGRSFREAAAVRVAEEQAEDIDGLNGPQRLAEAGGVHALIPHPEGVAEILFPRDGRASPRSVRRPALATRR